MLDLGDGRDLVVRFFKRDETDPLRHPARLADVLHRAAHDHPALGHDYEVVPVAHTAHADDLAVLFRDLDVGHTLAAARGDAVLLDLGALAEALFGDRQKLGLLVHDLHADHVVLAVEMDAADTARGAAHAPHAGPRGAGWPSPSSLP